MVREKVTKEDIERFKNEHCPQCILKGSCVKENKDDHWFESCPQFFNWRIGFVSWVAEELRWQREHPEENEAKQRELVNRAKKWKDEQKQSRSSKRVQKKKS